MDAETKIRHPPSGSIRMKSEVTVVFELQHTLKGEGGGDQE